VFECLTVIGSLIYIILAIKEVLHQGFRIFFQTLVGQFNAMYMNTVYVYIAVIYFF